jgi:flagellar export protein FliJ
MKAFHFALEQVRLWRRQQVEVEEVKLQKINAELNNLQLQAQQVQAEADEAGRLVLGEQDIAAHDLRSLDDFREYTRTSLKKIAEELRPCREKAEAQRQRLIEARRQFELLDHLKKKAMGLWRLARDKEQEELAAELFLAKRTRERD